MREHNGSRGEHERCRRGQWIGWGPPTLATLIMSLGAVGCQTETICPQGSVLMNDANGNPQCVVDLNCDAALKDSVKRDVGGTKVCACPEGYGLLQGAGSMICEKVGLPPCEYADQTNCIQPPMNPMDPPRGTLCEEFPDALECNPPQ